MPYRQDDRLLCPKCEEELEYRQDQGVAFAYCPLCRGIWLAADALQAVLIRTGSQDAAKVVSYLDLGFNHESIRRCVACRQSLLIREIMDVEIDYCPHCRGIFLDPGELGQIMASDAATAPSERFATDGERVVDAVWKWFTRHTCYW